MALTIECDGCPRCGSASEPVGIADCTAHPRWSAALPREIAWDRCLRCGHVHTREYWSPEGIDFMTAALASPLDVLSLMDFSRASLTALPERCGFAVADIGVAHRCKAQIEVCARKAPAAR